MTIFRPCIDLHQGKVKQIVGNTLTKDQEDLRINFVSDKTASNFAKICSQDKLRGGHLIMLGSGNKEAALDALKSYPGGLQVGGGISLDCASDWIREGASHVIVTSCLFDEIAHFKLAKLQDLASKIGKDKIVIDLSCKSNGKSWTVMKDNWQTATDLSLSESLLCLLSDYCDEFLIHATELEGKCQGIDSKLIKFLGRSSPLPCTYAGGVSSISDLDYIKSISDGRVDVTIGSGLDLFGGKLIKYKDCVSWDIDN